MQSTQNQKSTTSTNSTAFLSPKEIQVAPELWMWDYVHDDHKSEGGVGIYLVHMDGKAELLHFNEWWTDFDSFILEPSGNHREHLLRQTNFRLVAEL